MRWVVLTSALVGGCTFGGSAASDSSAASIGGTDVSGPADSGTTRVTDDGPPGSTTQSSTTAPSPSTEGAAGSTSASTSTGDGATMSVVDEGTSTSARGESTGDDDSSTGRSADTVVEEGLLVRYYLDEDIPGFPDGQTVADSAPGVPAFDLNVEFMNNEPDFLGAPPDHLGVRWGQISNAGVIHRNIAGSKLKALDDLATATIQVIAGVTSVSSQGSRYISTGQGIDTGAGHFDLASDNLDSIQLRIEENAPLLADWVVPIAPEPRVYTVLIDLNDDPPAQLFVDDTPVAGEFDSNHPVTFNIQDADMFSIGNRTDNDRAIVGDLLYVAIYDRVLTEPEVMHNLQVLAKSDDTP